MIINFFRKMKIVLLVVLLITAVGLALLLVPYSYTDRYGQSQVHYGIFEKSRQLDFSYNQTLFISAAIICIVMIVVTILINKFAIKKYKKILSLLYDECRPIEFLKEYEPICNQFKRVRTKGNLQVFGAFMNYANGLFAAGEIEKAAGVYKQLAFDKAIDANHMIGAKCQVNLALLEYYYSVQDSGNADICNRTLINAFERFSGNFLKNYERKLPEYKRQMNAVNQFYKGEYDNVKKYYHNAFEVAANNYERAYFGCRLATIYKELNDIDNAIKHLATAAIDGGSLSFVADARNKLERN